MNDKTQENFDQLDERLKKAEERLKDVAQGRAYVVGVQVLYKDKLGVVTNLNQGSEDPEGSTVDIRLHNGKIIQGIKVASKEIQRFRA